MFSPVTALDYEDTSYLDDRLLDDRGRPRVLPASTYADIPVNHRRLWCHRHGVYGLPTTELVGRITALIAGRRAIEIGSGNGCLGRVLGIPMTDSFAQRRADIAIIYALQGQPVVQYGDDVEMLDAAAAIAKYQPEVVVASWVTQLHSPITGGGSAIGVDEVALLQQTNAYIMFGSVRNHSSKVICAKKHGMYQADWMISRAEDSALFVWGEHDQGCITST